MTETTISTDNSELSKLHVSDIEFRNEVIYFIVVDRFRDGDPNNQPSDDPLGDPSHEDWGKYWGGDIQGIIDKLDYLQETGITALWLTPLFEQVEALETASDTAPIHGYWTQDFKRINARWVSGESETSLFQCKETVLDRLIAELHKRGMKFILDIVCNHSSPSTSEGKGRLYDDGKLVADFENDTDHWYHHYGGITNWENEWQVQNCDVAGLATFNENNIIYRRHIKEAIKLWLDRGVDALRIDTVKHMPIWFWQEFNTDMLSHKPDLFIFGEWINSHPENKTSIEYANRAGMSLLDFGLCFAIRECLGKRHAAGFKLVQDILSKDGAYRGATDLVTFIDNHDMSRFQNLNKDEDNKNLALTLLLTSRGIPCLFYGCEQYLYSEINGGDDPYNRPMMKSWGMTEARRVVKILSDERRQNRAMQWGGQWPVLVEADVYVYLRRYKEARCAVFLNRGEPTIVSVNGLAMNDGRYTCILGGTVMEVTSGEAQLNIGLNEAKVFSVRDTPCEATAIVRIQVNHAPVEPGCRLAIIGNCPELGEWNLEAAVMLECINSNTWFGELPFDQSAGLPIAYKFVIFEPSGFERPLREATMPRRRSIPAAGVTKWRDTWNE